MSEGGLGRLFEEITAPLVSGGRLPGFAGATGWINSPPLGEEDLRGRVVLVDFWTYTCINWLRTLGYVRAWAERYADHGLLVVGVHTPEFPFEGDADNVRRAVGELNVTYPVALDPDYAVWNAFANRYWPAAYVADARGRIRHHQFGEGGYEECERAIQRFLREAGGEDVPDGYVSVPGAGLELQADWEHLGSPETYVNVSPRPAKPHDLELNQWTLLGDWRTRARASVLERAGGGIAFRFHARDVNLVLGPAEDDAAPIPFRVTLDGEPPGDAHGLDVDAEGRGEVTEERLYQLLRRPAPIVDATVEIDFDAPGVGAYVFTFG
jgi:thiol-disulfide isomerase/thioredoxin